ncbi:hypothetical protein TNCV_2452501 [Trichonephila clavipes]|nr:hypothetical protein TNCV_2452501 [Trichonephila clavipes]
MAASTSRVCSSSMFLMKWNGIMESFLIDEVEKLPYLWNPRHPHFTKRLKKKLISADRHEDEREVAGTGSFLHARNNMYFCSVSGSDCFDKNLSNYRQSQFGVDNNATATAYVLKSGTGAIDLFPSGNTSLASSSFDDTIQPLDSISNLDYMELEVNATSLNVSDEDLFENDVELPPIPNRAPSESELPQRVRVFTSTPVTTSTPPVTTSTPPLDHLNTSSQKKKKS